MSSGNFSERKPALILLSGLPGSGKTTFAQALLRRILGEHIESDAIRAGLGPEPTFTFAESGRVFARVEADARRAIASGKHAVVDATNLTHKDRKRFMVMAKALALNVVPVRVVAPEATIRERLSKPRVGHSRAGLDIYERMHDRPQPFAVAAVVVDTRFAMEPSLELVAALAEGLAE